MRRAFRRTVARSRAAALRGLLLAAVTGAAACGAGPVPPAPAQAQELLYVAGQDAASVSVIDMTARKLVATVDLQALGFSPTSRPHHTAVEPDGSFWYVSLIGGGTVLKFDRENRLVGQAEFETPGLLGLDPTSNRLYVGRSMAAVNPPRRVGVVDRTTMAIEEVDVFISRPHALAVDAAGDRFFAASMGEDQMAWAPVGEEEVDLLPFESAMHHHMVVQFAVSPEGRWLVGGGQMSGELLVFDLSSEAPELSRSLAVGGQPWHPTWTPDGREIWIPNQAANTVSVIDTQSWTVTDVISHPALAEPHGTAISRDGRTVWVSSNNTSGRYRPADGSDRRPGTVVAIDTSSHEVVAVIEVGAYASGMATAAVVPGQR